MRKFDFKDYGKLQRTSELEESLNHFDGALPILLLPFTLYSEYDKHIRGLENEKEIRDKYYETRINHMKSNDRDKFRERQLMDWLDENPQFHRLLIEATRKEYI